MVTDHATLIHLLKQSRDKLIDRQIHWVEKLMPCANLMRIINRKGILNEADPVSRRPDFLPVDNLRGPDESLWWDRNVHDIDTNGKDPSLLALSILLIFNVDDNFLSKLKGSYSFCNYLSNENIEKRLRQKIYKSSVGLFQYHNRVVIPRPVSNIIKAFFY